MTDVFFLDHRFIATPSYGSLVAFVTKKHGVSGWLENWILRSTFLLDKVPLNESQKLWWDKINQALGYRIIKALIAGTDNQQTRFYGVVETDQQIYRIKTYQNPDDAYHEYTQTKLVEDHFSGPFVIPHVINCQDGVLVTDCIVKQRPITSEDAVLDRLFYYTDQAITQSKTSKIPKDIIPLNFPSLFVKLENSDLIRRIREWLQQATESLPMIAIHGDMTPWNIHVDIHERLILNSFERAGWHVPYYDVFHFMLQPLALSPRNKISIVQWIEQLDITTYPWLQTALMLYLIDQLCCDLTDLYDKEYNDPWLSTMIENKANWLEQLLV